MSSNGDHVTWRELNLALEPIREDVQEIKRDVKDIRGNTWLGPRGHEFLVGGSFLVCVVTLAVALLLH
jgi:hypothetical protein